MGEYTGSSGLQTTWAEAYSAVSLCIRKYNSERTKRKTERVQQLERGGVRAKYQQMEQKNVTS